MAPFRDPQFREALEAVLNEHNDMDRGRCVCGDTLDFKGASTFTQELKVLTAHQIEMAAQELTREQEEVTVQ